MAYVEMDTSCMRPCCNSNHNFFLPRHQDGTAEVALAWYQNVDGKLTIVDPEKVNHDLSVEDVFADRVRVPINLAIKNADGKPLEVVRVELSFGADLNIKPGGQPKIDPTGQTLIYEHDIGTLENVNEYTPLRPIDTIEIPFHFIKDRFITLFGDETPVQMAILVGQDIIRKSEVVLNMKVFCKDRPPVDGRVRISIHTGVQVFSDIQDAIRIATQPGDDAYFSPNLPYVRKITSWSATNSRSGKTINYELLDTESDRIQRIAINGVIRRVTVDENKSGLLSFMLLSPAAKETSIIRMKFGRQWPLIDWPENEAR
jgi:hypothetical protein